MKISYYELLEMIKERNIPEKVIYKENTYYWLNIRYATQTGAFLSDIDEIRMFDKCIEIPNNDFEDILEWGEGALEEIETKRNYKIAELQKYICILMQTQNQLINNQKKIIQKLKEKK